MAYEIISIGDAEMLYNTFQGAAMIFGNGSLNKLINAGFTLGILLVSINYLTNQEFPLRYALVGLIAYLVLFVPKDTVVIEDVYTGEVRTVANVPLGIAAPMSIISTMGVKMTEMFETAFSTPSEASMLGNGYLNSLNTLMKLRNIGLGSAGSDDSLSGDVGETIHSYIENCVMLDLELSDSDHEVTRETLQKSTGLLDALKTSFINIDILVKLPTMAPAGEQKSCKDAYTTLSTYLRGDNFVDQLDRYVAGVLGIKDATVRASEKIDQAKAALNLAGQDSQTYMENALLASYLKDGPVAFIKRPGQEQLNLQWASEQTMFNEIARPLMAFVEMFTVAISPIVAFLTTLGPIGMTMMVRYVQLMLWISLWGPLMAVCNLYITIVTTRALGAVATYAETNGTGLDAMIMHDQTFQTLETWLSAGGMLASSVPALALMIVYGGSVAATNLSGKMTSGASSSVNPGRVAPDAVSIDSPMKLGSKNEYSPNTGSKKSGMADTTFSTSSTFGRASQSATDSLRSASSSASQSLNSMTQLSSKSGSMSSDTGSVMNSLTNSKSESDNWAASTGRTIGNRIGRTEGEKEAIATGVSASLAAGLGAGGISPATLGASGQAELQSTASMDAAKSKEMSDQIQKTWNQEYAGSSQVAEMQQSAQQHSDQTFFGSEEMKAKGEQYMSQLQAVNQASEKFTQTASLQDSSGKSLSLPYQDLARRLNNSGAIVEINQANKELEDKMGSPAYQKLSNDAQYEINRSSASGLVGGDRDALAGFLKLNQQDPVKAAAILNNAITPTSSGSGVNLSPAEFQKDGKSVDGIVNNETAAGFRSKANGEDSEYDTGDTGGGVGGRTSTLKQPASHLPVHQEHATKSSQTSANKSATPGHPTNKDSSAGNSKSATLSPAGSQKSKIDSALKNSNLGNTDEFRKNIEAGGKIDNSKDMSHMMGRAFRNEGSLAYDSTVTPVANAAKSAMTSVGEGVESAENFINNALGGGDSKSSKPSNPSDNDLPPTPKK
jgi:conjugal transfer mating pair stabilization protein TraG